MMRRKPGLTLKVLKKLLRREHVLLHELHVAKELGMTLTQLRREMTYEELWLWVTYFGVIQDINEEARQKASKRRR